uniref:GTP-binding protein 10 n=1 Tax=Branchiostoma floridae TaxID=7739 RepID=C3YSP5_BRAFL|eukprot:XP_002600734.1 hypothetical protein BRAFLDRAFT_123502 [Branchiostoma floridae]
MVFLTRILFRAPTARKRGFVDKLRVYVRGGSGGMGLPKYNGRGGDGGHVIFVAKEDMTLKQVIDSTPNKRFIAGIGANASRRAIQGDKGHNLTVEVPTGITLLTDTKQVIATLNQPGDQATVAKGGAGGAHWSDFHPKKGQIRSVTLELKLISDIGLVGFPNAGKSTLLKAVSSADPKIADYPFTTMRPQIGIIQYQDLRRVSLADLPGLIEGAHHNAGMGHHFLRHVERTKLLLFMVDVHGFILSMKHPHRTAFQTVALLMKELELYKSDLVDKPAVLAINKIDIEGAGDKAEELLDKLDNFEETSNNSDHNCYQHPLTLPNPGATLSSAYQQRSSYENTGTETSNVSDQNGYQLPSILSGHDITHSSAYQQCSYENTSTEKSRMSEQNCYLHPSTLPNPGATLSSAYQQRSSYENTGTETSNVSDQNGYQLPSILSGHDITHSSAYQQCSYENTSTEKSRMSEQNCYLHPSTLPDPGATQPFASDHGSPSPLPNSDRSEATCSTASSLPEAAADGPHAATPKETETPGPGESVQDDSGSEQGGSGVAVVNGDGVGKSVSDETVSMAE